MKAILVIDVPEVDYLDRSLWKPKIEYTIYNQVLINNKPVYVDIGIHGYEELKPLPLKKTDFEDMMFSWNDCIDEILGGNI